MNAGTFFRRISVLTLLAALMLCAVPALADKDNKDTLNGTWVPEVEKSLDLLITAGVVDAAKRDEAREGLSTLKAAFNVPAGQILGELKGKGSLTPILEIADNPDGSVYIRTDRHEDTIRFLPNGSILTVHSHLVLKKEQ